jgi:hypothetical protein
MLKLRRAADDTIRTLSRTKIGARGYQPLFALRRESEDVYFEADGASYRLTFHTWRPRRVWLSGQARLTFGEPIWEHLRESDVTAFIGEEEMRSLPPPVPAADDSE